MKFKLVILCLPFFLVSLAQVGVNTSNPKAVLDIVATDPITPNTIDGLLIPRVNSLSSFTPTANQNSMMVYLKNEENYTNNFNGDNYTCKRFAGFYYWKNNESSWYPISLETDANNNGTLLYDRPCKKFIVSDIFSGTLASDILYTSTSTSTPDWKKFIVNNVILDNNTLYDNSTGIYTCKNSGTYKINITLDITANISSLSSNADLVFIFGLVKLATGNNGSETPSVSGNLYVTRNTALFYHDTSPAIYSQPYSITAYANLEAGKKYVFGGSSWELNGGSESIRINYQNSGTTGAGFGSNFSIERVK